MIYFILVGCIVLLRKYVINFDEIILCYCFNSFFVFMVIWRLISIFKSKFFIIICFFIDFCFGEFWDFILGGLNVIIINLIIFLSLEVRNLFFKMYLRRIIIFFRIRIFIFFCWSVINNCFIRLIRCRIVRLWFLYWSIEIRFFRKLSKVIWMEIGVVI